MHVSFSIFGSLHWPRGAQNLHATPIVDGNDDAIRAVEWARNVYEQLPLYWVALATDTTRSDVFFIHSGEGGMMVNQHMDYLPHVDIDECLQAPGFPRILEEHVAPDRWKASMDNLYVHLHHTNIAALLRLAGQWHFPGSLHAYGKTKRNFRTISSIVLAYEMLCRKVFLMQHPNFSNITRPSSVDP